MTDPLVSVIVTTRNNADTLTPCLRSIMGQTYDNIELIVVDN
ncbi:glycosyltransferase, partial [Candidatus Saccharibacteria bacterium]|nr:glycosyltransferase [Candidatus Saccharibacteria bacterium]